jgi:hypothetical protein
MILSQQIDQVLLFFLNKDTVNFFMSASISGGVRDESPVRGLSIYCISGNQLGSVILGTLVVFELSRVLQLGKILDLNSFLLIVYC